MDNLNDLKKIWLSANTERLPSAGQMMQIIKKYRDQKIWKKAALILAALLIAAMMIVVMFVYKSTMITTRIGELMMITAALILVVTNTRSLNRIYKLKNCSNKDFVAHLAQARRNQLYYYKKTQVAGMAISSVGLLLYDYEFSYLVPFAGIFIYAFTIAWISVLWLVVRPRAFKKYSRKTLDLLERAKVLSEQF
jgi:hypothetical protein